MGHALNIESNDLIYIMLHSIRIDNQSKVPLFDWSHGVPKTFHKLIELSNLCF